MIEHNGKKYARVSTILKPFSDYSHIDPVVLDNKCKLGTRVHKAIEDDLRGEFPLVDIPSMKYFVSFEKWRNHINPEFSKSEERYFCEEKMITGQIDAICCIENQNILVDFKTSSQESPAWVLQAHLYHYLVSKSGYPISDTVFFLKLDKNADFPKVFQYKIDKNTMKLCFDSIDKYWKSDKK